MRLWRLFKSQCYIQTSWVFNTTSLSILSLAHRGEIIGGQTLRAGQHVPLGGRNPGDKVCLPSLITCSWDFPSGRTGWFYLSPWRSRTCTPPMSGAGEACEGRWPKPKTTENPMKNPAQSKWQSSGTLRHNPIQLRSSGTIRIAGVGLCWKSFPLRETAAKGVKTHKNGWPMFFTGKRCQTTNKLVTWIWRWIAERLENELPQVKAGGTRPEVLDFSLGNITKPKVKFGNIKKMNVKCCSTITLQWTMIWQ